MGIMVNIVLMMGHAGFLPSTVGLKPLAPHRPEKEFRTWTRIGAPV